MNEIWYRQPGDTTKSYSAFCAYRDLGPGRSLRKAAESMGRRDYQMFEKWSYKTNWVNRVTAYDDHNERVKREAEEQADIELWKTRRKKFKEDQFRVGSALMSVGGKAVVHLDKRAELIQPNEAAKMIETGSAQISRAIGEPDVISEQRGGKSQNAVIDADFAQTLLNWAINPNGGKSE